MKCVKMLPAVLLLGAVVLAADPPPAAPGLVIVDANGKEQKLKSWKFVAGTRHLGWLAPAAPPREKDDKPKEKDDKPAKPQPADLGPVAIEFRDDNSTNLVEGVLTFLLPEHLKSLDYDNEKHTATANVFLGEKADGELSITGSTEYEGSNRITIEAEIDKGDAGIAEVKYLGGTAKGIRGIRFPAPKPVAEQKGRPAFVSIEFKTTKHREQLTDLQPLYRFAEGGQRLLPTLQFKKTLKLDVAKISRLRADGRDADGGTECAVTTKDGEEQTYTLLKTVMIDGKTATLEALVGKLRGGYKYYPATTLHSMHFDVQFDEKKEKEDKP